MKYIKSILRDNKFLVSVKLKFEGLEESEFNAILDTGCQHSHISINNILIYLSDESIKEDKQKYMKSRDVCIGLGVESQNKNVSQDITDVSNPRIVIRHRMYDIKINDISIGNRYMGVSYDTSGVAVIGMQFMKDWDIHIGKNKQGETVLLACPISSINPEYLEALENEFGLISLIDSNRIRNQGGNIN